MYKFLLITIFFLLASFGSINKTNDVIETENTIELSDQGYMYRTLGTYALQMQDGSLISVEAYIWKRANNSGIYAQYKYEYVLTAVSRSVHRGQLTKTWLYGSRVFMDNNELTYNLHPQGVTLYVNLGATSIYNWYTNDENVGKFYFTWVSSAYEPRL
jgi:hypothetical protein